MQVIILVIVLYYSHQYHILTIIIIMIGCALMDTQAMESIATRALVVSPVIDLETLLVKVTSI